jgi:hypothetical protein
MNQNVTFANRSAEISSVLKLLTEEREPRRVLIFRTSKAMGSSSFLKYSMTRVPSKDIAVYSDFWPEGIAQLADAYKDERDRRWRCRIGSFIDAVTPLMGLFSKMALLTTAGLSMSERIGATAVLGLSEGVLVTPFPSSTMERLLRGLTMWPRLPVVFMIDNAQQKPREVLALLNACAAEKHYGHARFVLTYSDAEEQLEYEEFRKRLPFRASAVIERQFVPIDSGFVDAVAKARGLVLDRAECQSLADRAENDMWTLMSLLEGDIIPTASHKDTGLSPIATFTLRLLLVAEQPLRRSDVRMLGLRSQLVVNDELAGLNDAIENLRRRRLVEETALEGSDAFIALASQSAPPVRTLSLQTAENLVTRRDLYDYFRKVTDVGSMRHAPSSSAALLYRLARIVDPAAIPALAQRLVEVAMGQGSFEDAKQYVDAARPPDGVLSLYDQFVQIAFFVSVQDYERAKGVLDVIPHRDFQHYRILRILDAVALNRTRKHLDSDRQIDELLTEDSSIEEKCLLVSYKISGLLHEERFEDALSVFGRWRRTLRRARNYAYFLRNSAAVFMWGPGKDLTNAEDVLAEAEAAFTKLQDGFGIATTQCNRGVAKAYRGDLKFAEKLFRDSFDVLSSVGTQHVQESGTNLGTVMLLSGRVSDACNHLNSLLTMMDMDFPRIIAECDLAIADLVSDRKQDAKRRMRALVSIVDDEVRIRDASRRVRLTTAIVEAAVAESPERVELYLQEVAKLGGGEEEVARIRRAANDPHALLESAVALYPFEYLQYWSQNPLKMLPAELLTPQTKFDDVA